MSLLRSFNLIVLGCALLAGGCDRQTEAPAQPGADAPAKAAAGKLDRSHKGEALPALSFTDAAGDETALASLAGKPALVNLWATWCAPCIAELPTLNGLSNRADLNLEVVTIAQDIAPPEKIQQFLDQRGLAQLPSLRDPESELSFHYQTGSLPTTVLYDAAGKEVWRYVGDRDWTSDESMKLLAEGEATGPV